MLFDNLFDLLFFYVQTFFVMLGSFLAGIVRASREIKFDHRIFPSRKARSEAAELLLEPQKWVNYSSFLSAVEDGGQQRVALLTGANGTIGSEILKLLLKMDFAVITVGKRSPMLLPKIRNLKMVKQLEFIQCDLQDVNQVNDTVKLIRQNYDHIDLFVSVAGIYIHTWSHLFEQLFRLLTFSRPKIVDSHFAINLFSHVRMFTQLEDLMEKSQNPSPRCVFVSSTTSRAGDISLLLENPEKFWSIPHFIGYKAYADSKLLISLYAKYLANRLSQQGSKIRAVSTHPGIVPGGAYRNLFFPIRIPLLYIASFFVRQPETAAKIVLGTGLMDQFTNGAYYEDGEEIELVTKMAPERLDKLGRTLEKMVGVQQQ